MGEVERQFVASLYPGEKWRKRVARMPDAQVLAIYFRQKDKPSPTKKARKKKESGTDELPF